VLGVVVTQPFAIADSIEIMHLAARFHYG